MVTDLLPLKVTWVSVPFRSDRRQTLADVAGAVLIAGIMGTPVRDLRRGKRDRPYAFRPGRSRDGKLIALVRLRCNKDSSVGSVGPLCYTDRAEARHVVDLMVRGRQEEHRCD